LLKSDANKLMISCS